MTRRTDWPERLAQAVDRGGRAGWQWGVHDCCTWTADVVAAMTGQDPLADIRGRWRTAAGAGRMLRRLGGLQAAVSARLGPPLPALVLAQRGDVVLLHTPQGDALGVCAGAVVLAPGLQGLSRWPLVGGQPGDAVHAALAWRV